jgi:hypothetical protein
MIFTYFAQIHIHAQIRIQNLSQVPELESRSLIYHLPRLLENVDARLLHPFFSQQIQPR